MFRSLALIQRCASLKPSLGFQALHNTEIRTEVEKHSHPKLDALVDVILSLKNNESEYLSLIQTQKVLDNNQSILTNKIINKDGYKL